MVVNVRTWLSTDCAALALCDKAKKKDKNKCILCEYTKGFS